MSKKESILILPNRLMLGGIEKVLLDALQVLHQHYEIEILCFCGEECRPILDSIPADVKVINKQLPKGKFLRFLGKLPILSKHYYRKTLGNKHYDHLIIMRPSVMNAVYVNNARHKIYWTHNDYYLNYAGKNLSLKKRISKWVRRFTYRKFNMIWTVSETICEEMGRCFSLNNIHALPNPLNCTQIRKKSLEPCNLEMNSTKNNFIMIGRMSREKGFHRILRFMCTEALHKYPDGHLYVIGNDTNSDRLRKSVEQQGLTGRVHLLGPQANPYPYLRQAQFLICPSLSESFGLAMLEAMLLRVRIITTDTVGGKYITQNGKLARCVPNNDTALCNAVSEYLEDMSCYQYSLEDAEKWAEHHDIGLFGIRLMELLKNE